MIIDIEKERLLKEIYEAFAGVTREGGVSWSESEAIDDCASESERMEARAMDVEPSWESLVDDPNWEPMEGGLGGFSFMDSVGYRYYLPAAMVETLKTNSDAISFHLTLWQENSRKELSLMQWSLLTRRQKLCIRDFLKYQVRRASDDGALHGTLFDLWAWQQAYDSYWKGIPDIIIEEQ